MWADRRRFSESGDYGEKFEYDPHWIGPLEVERKKTDFGFIIVLGIYWVIWLVNGIYAFCTGDVRAIYKDFHLDYLYPFYSDAIYVVLGFTVLGICLNLTIIFLLRYFPRAVFFTSFFGIFALLFTYIGILFYEGVRGHEELLQSPETTFGVAFAGICIPTAIVAGLSICVFMFRRKIFIGCGVIKESAKAVMFFPSSFFFPILPFTLYLLTVAFTACTWVCLYENSSTQNGDMPYHLYLLHGINFFGFWWMVSFVHAFSKMVLAGTFATWYWSADKARIPKRVIFKYMVITIRFHLGTLAFGSLIIAIIEATRYLLDMGFRRSVERNDLGSAICFSCFECICAITERIVDKINTKAYIMCTMHGDNLVQSAIGAFNLWARNYMKFWAVGCVTTSIFMMGDLFVVLISVSATYGFCRMFTNFIVLYTAVALVFVTTSLTSYAMFSVLDIAIDTIFLCVLEDDERNNGSRERPYFMTPEMRQLLMRDHFRV